MNHYTVIKNKTKKYVTDCINIFFNNSDHSFDNSSRSFLEEKINKVLIL